MKVGIVGAGRVGSALASSLRRAGYEIVFGSRSPGAADKAPIAFMARAVGVVILAVPSAAIEDVIASAGGFDGKILIDATNPVAMSKHGLGLSVGLTSSGAEQIAALAPRASVFKAFNQTGFENMAAAGAYPTRPVMFVAGDDETAKPTVLMLVEDCGFEAIDLGGLRQARLLEPLALLWIELSRKLGFGRDFTFALQRSRRAASLNDPIAVNEQRPTPAAIVISNLAASE